MTHKDDKFRLNECKQCDEMAADIQTLLNTNMVLVQGGEELHTEVTRLTTELEKCTAVAIMYREQIKRYQQDETWYQQRVGG